MGFLQNMALKRAEKFCRRYMDDGEVVLAFDIGKVPMSGTQVALMVTTQAAYVAPLPLQGKPMIFPYLLLQGADHYQRMLILTSGSGGQMMIEFTGALKASAIVVQEVAKARALRTTFTSDEDIRRALGPKKAAYYDAMS